MAPIYTFWTFPFERFSGILESFSKKWLKPEEQIHQNLVNFQSLKTTPPEYSVMKELYSLHDCKGPLQQTQVDTQIFQQYKSNATCPVNSINTIRLDICNVPSKIYEQYFTDDKVDNLIVVHAHLYPGFSLSHVPKLFCLQ